MVCPNVNELEERLIDVSWSEFMDKKYPTNILVQAVEGKDLLLDIIAKTANTDITIQSINSINNSESFLYDIVVLVKDKDKLIKFMGDIKMIPNVISVERWIK